jgi:hypothetical protein
MLDTISNSFEKANRAYGQGQFDLAEKILKEALLDPGNTLMDEERICDCLAALACEQGLYASAAYWYLQVLQFKGCRLQINDRELREAIRNYQILRRLSNNAQGFFYRLSA